MAHVTAIVVNFNGGERTVRCIAALRAQTVTFTDIIVIDNASTDGSVDALTKQFPSTIILRQAENLGLSKARNIGLQRAESPLVLSIDSDTYLRQDALEQLLRVQASTGAAVLCPRSVFYPECTEIQCDGAEVHFMGTFFLRNAGSTDLLTVPDPVKTGGATGGCLLLNREVVLKSGGFNELFFFYHEDIEFSLRVRSLGHDIVTVAAAVVDHDRGEGTPGLSFRGKGTYPAMRARLSMRNRLILILIHYQARSLLVLFPALLVYEIGTVSFAAMRGWLRHYGKAIAEIVESRSKILEYRRTMQANRTRGDRQLFTADELTFGAGVMHSRWERAASRFVVVTLGCYWRLVRRLLKN